MPDIPQPIYPPPSPPLLSCLLNPAIPCKGDNPTQRDVLIRIMPECASVDVFRQAKLDAKLAEDLRSVDECLANVARQYKIGVLSCETNQETEAEMYNNGVWRAAFLLRCS